MLLPGTRIAGYVIEEWIGAGGMAVVYRARDEVLGRTVAIKVMSPALASDEEFRTRFLRESRAVAAVDEPHIVPVYAAGDAGGALYIATRFVAGGDLSGLQRAAGGPLPPAEAADFVAQVASALDAAHAIGLVHRDVKPGNILIERIPGRAEHAYLSDFGLSKSTSADATGLTVTGQFMGTPDYCAPEQIAGAEVDGRADQYSLACVAFCLLAGAVPFGRGDALARLYAHVNSPVPALTSIRPELPPAVDGVLARGMAKDPAERYESCGAFAAALRGALGIGADALTGAPLPQEAVPNGDLGHEPTVTAEQHPSVPPQTQSTVAAGNLGYQPTVTAGAGQHPSLPPGSGDRPPQGPGQEQRPPRKRSGLIIGASVAAVVVVAGVLVSVPLLLSKHGTTGDVAGHGSSGATTPAAGTTTPAAGAISPSPSSPPAEAYHTGTATLVGSLSAPGGSPMEGAFFSADGKYIAAETSQSEIYIFSAETLKLVNTVSVAADNPVWPVSFSADDKTLYVAGWAANNTFHLFDFDVASGKAATYSMPDGGSTFTSVSGRMIGGDDLSATSDSVIEYDMATGKAYAQVPNPGGDSMVENVAPDADGNYILISDHNDMAYLVDMRSKQVLGTFPYAYSDQGSNFPQLSTDGNTVYVPGGAHAAPRLWDRATRTYITPTGSRWPDKDNWVFALFSDAGVLFGVDGKFALTSPAATSETVDIWNIAARADVITTVPGATNRWDLSLGPNGSELLTTAGSDADAGNFTQMDLWSIPG